MSDDCELTILMPCLNEAETLATCIRKATLFLTQENIQGEILIADNGSTDGSQTIAIEQGARVIHVDKKGYGAALKSGIEAAKGRYIIMGDADDSYDFLKLDGLLARLREGFDLVMGNRFRGGIQKGAMPFLNRYLGNPVLSFLGRLCCQSNIGDFHCGLRGFSRDAIRQLHLRGDGMEFASEMIVKATLHQLKITEVPTSLFPDGRSRRPHLRPWRDGWRHLRLLLLLSPKWLFYYPGMTLLLMGLLLMLRLMMGPIEFGQVNFDIHTLLFSGLFMIVGVQAISFAAFAKQVAHVHLHLPVEATVKKIKLFSLEKGLIAGIFLLCLGLIGAFYSFFYWFHHAFGPLIPVQMMRMLIPAVTFLIIGVQIIFASFFMGLLNLHYDR